MRFEIVDAFYKSDGSDTSDDDAEILSDTDDVVKRFTEKDAKPIILDDLSEINHMLDSFEEKKKTVTATLRDGDELTAIISIPFARERIKFTVHPYDLKHVKLDYKKIVIFERMRREVWEFLQAKSSDCILEFHATVDYFADMAPVGVSLDETLQVLNKFKTLVISEPYFAFGSLGIKFSLLDNIGDLTILNLNIPNAKSQENLDALLKWLPPSVRWLTIRSLATFKTFESLRSLVKRHANLRYLIFLVIQDFTLEKLIIKEFIQERKIVVQHFGSFTSHVNFSESSMLKTIVHLVGVNSGGSFCLLGPDVRRMLVTLIFGEFPSSIYFR